MFSDSCRYEDNTFRANESGVAVMYSKRVHITGNTFERNRGSAAYGLLLKEITDSEVRGNRFIENSIALHMEGASRNAVVDNDFVRNGWAVRVLADAQENVLRGNAFAGNVFDVGTNSRRNYSTFTGNWWDRYAGYDLDHDGRGDVSHAPVRLFALLVEQSPAALVLTRSLLVDLLDIAERVVPALTPETLRDAAPLMHAPRKLP
jgi:nitrous oxidase accessory protein